MVSFGLLMLYSASSIMAEEDIALSLELVLRDPPGGLGGDRPGGHDGTQEDADTASWNHPAVAFGAIGIALLLLAAAYALRFGAPSVSARRPGWRPAIRAGQAGPGGLPGIFRDVEAARDQQRKVQPASGGPGGGTPDLRRGGGGPGHGGCAGSDGGGGLFRGRPGVALLRGRGGCWHSSAWRSSSLFLRTAWLAWCSSATPNSRLSPCSIRRAESRRRWRSR